MKKNIAPFKVINWNVNTDSIEYYDIMPYLMDKYKEIKKSNRPTSFNDVKKFIRDNSLYQFWSRCEYEVVITGWPKHRNEVKIDVFKQIEQNLDVITNHFISQL